jgi:hypothetical protein
MVGGKKSIFKQKTPNWLNLFNFDDAKWPKFVKTLLIPQYNDKKIMIQSPGIISYQIKIYQEKQYNTNTQGYYSKL